MLSDKACDRLKETESDSFVLDLKKWHQIMTAYLDGGHAYHTTMPTDGLAQFYDAMLEMKAFGFDNAKSAQIELGTKLRQIVEGYGYKSLAAKAFQSPTVIVSHTDRDDIKNGACLCRSRCPDCGWRAPRMWRIQCIQNIQNRIVRA